MSQQDTFKQALSQFATGVCIITFRHPHTNGVGGVTISAFSSLSLDPAKILFCLGKGGHCEAAFADVDAFAVNILNSEQCALAYQFAGRNREGLDDVIEYVDDLPIIKNSLAHIVCNKGNSYTEGDHDIIIGDVTQITLSEEPREPLLYFKSKIVETYRHEHE